MSDIRKDLIHRFPQRMIFDSLDENGLTFGIYYQNIHVTLFFKSLRKLKHVTNLHSYSLKFKLHAKLGKLSNYVVLEHRYFDVNFFPANDNHPSHDVALGQRFVKEVYETLRGRGLDSSILRDDVDGDGEDAPAIIRFQSACYVSV